MDTNTSNSIASKAENKLASKTKEFLICLLKEFLFCLLCCYLYFVQLTEAAEAQVLSGSLGEGVVRCHCMEGKDSPIRAIFGLIRTIFAHGFNPWVQPMDSHPWVQTHGFETMGSNPWVRTHGFKPIGLNPSVRTRGREAMGSNPWAQTHGFDPKKNV